MQLSGRPLFDNSIDRAHFADRVDELALLSFAIRSELNVLLWGEPGSGKTSLARALMFDLRKHDQYGRPEPPPPAIFVHASGITDPEVLLREVAHQVEQFTGNPEHRRDASVRDNLGSLRQRAGEVGRHTARASGVGPHPAAMLVLDDVSAEAGHGVFGRLRDQVWELPYIWLVTARTSERAGLLLPPADAFFEREIELSGLSADAVRQLVQLRTDGSLDDAVDEIIAATDRNPRRVLEVLRDMGGPGSPHGSVRSVASARAVRDHAIEALGRPEAMLATELAALGAASASDDALLSRLGWTRSRAAQVFKTLETAGLVRSEPLRGGPGRPKKVYRLTPPAQFTSEKENEDGS